MESMREYAVRRAFEVKQYRKVLRETGIGEDKLEWMNKFARDQIPNPGADRVEVLYRYYKSLEPMRRRNGA